MQRNWSEFGKREKGNIHEVRVNDHGDHGKLIKGCEWLVRN